MTNNFQYGNELIELSETLSLELLSGYSGDVNNAINAATGIASFVPINHPIFDMIAPFLGRLSASAITDLSFDILLRFSAGALIGRQDFPEPEQFVQPGLALLLEGRVFPMKKGLPIDLLMTVWREDPEIFCKNQFSTFLFAQYAARLITHCGLQIPAEEIDHIKTQMRDSLGELELAIQSRQTTTLRAASLYLLGASTLVQLGDPSFAAGLVQMANDQLEMIIHALSTDDGDRLKKILGTQGHDSLCFIGFNTYLLDESFQDQTDLMLEIVRQCLQPKLAESHLGFATARTLGLRLAGLRCLVSNELADKVVAEFGAAVEMDVFRRLRAVLNATDTWTTWQEDLRAARYHEQEITAEGLHRLINDPTKFRYRPIGGRLPSPQETLDKMEADCKGVTALIAAIMHKNNQPLWICYYFGQDFIPNEDNHVFVELEKMEDYTLQNIPVDIGVPFGERQPHIQPGSYVRCSIQDLLMSDPSAVLAALAAQRAQIRKTIRS